MQSTLTSVTNPRWADEAHTMIDCEITTSQFGDEVLPFTASVNDPEPHGRGIYADVVAGVYGPIADYVPLNISENPTPSSGSIPDSVL
jgi:hypothetical protein